MKHQEAIDLAERAYCGGGGGAEGMEDGIRAYLNATGMTIVPLEPTEDMVNAGFEVDGSWEIARACWELMVPAAPDPFTASPPLPKPT